MKSQEFVLQKLIELTNNLQDELLEYHFCTKTHTHIIKVVNESLYGKDSFKYQEADIYDEFYELDTDEELMFISDSNDFEFIQNPYFIITNGGKYTIESYTELLHSQTSSKIIEELKFSDLFYNETINFNSINCKVNTQDCNFALAA